MLGQYDDLHMMSMFIKILWWYSPEGCMVNYFVIGVFWYDIMVLWGFDTMNMYTVCCDV